MEQDVSKRVGICGLYCGTCPFYLAFRKNDMEYMQKMSQEKGFPVEELQCHGCQSDNVSVHCKDCVHGFRICAEKKHVKWCFECEEFPCQRLKDFSEVHIVNGIKHHEHVIDDLKYMKKHGIQEWVKIQDKKARCKGCGEVLYWFDLECPDCKLQAER